MNHVEHYHPRGVILWDISLVMFAADTLEIECGAGI